MTDPTKSASPRSTAAQSLLLTGALVAVLYMAADRVMEDVLGIESIVGQFAEILIMAPLTSVVLWLGVLRPLHREVSRERRAADTRQDQMAAQAAQQDFEGRLHRALEMAATEDMAYVSTRKALVTGVELDAEVLLADSSDAHLKRVLVVAEDGPARCGVVAPHDCPAVRRTQSLVFASSQALDACPHLADRPSGPCSAACVPVSVAGRSIGVIHTVGAEGRPPDQVQVNTLEAIANQSGSRIGMLRVMSATTLQAATDPLTGLLNRRSFENRAHELLRRGTGFSLAMGDFDRFKALNDTHGHDAGDRALRLFSNVVRRSLRTEDLVSRYGGEEFVFVFPDKDLELAREALQRLQQELVVALAGGSVPGFTISFGVAHSDEATSLEELCRVADAALFRAKRNGRDRIEVEVPGLPPLATVVTDRGAVPAVLSPSRPDLSSVLPAEGRSDHPVAAGQGLAV
jgi:diguanylate cyclase (GGDEF)-like protein